MPFGAVTLVPGVNTERTPTLLRTGVSSSSLVRYKDGLVQKLGGWSRYYQSPIAGTPRALHGWQDLELTKHLAVGTTSQLGVITNNSFLAITPQTLVSNTVPNISTTSGSSVVTIVDAQVTDPTTFDSVQFNVPVSIGGLILNGVYPIKSIVGTHSYTIDAGYNATTSVSNPSATNGATASGNAILHFASTPAWIAAGMLVYDITTPASIVTGTQVNSTTGTTVTMSVNATGAGVGSGDDMVFASLPIFTTTSGSSLVTVKLLNHGISAAGLTVTFNATTTGNGVTVFGVYPVIQVIDANQFTILTSSSASSSGSFPMNNGAVQLQYYISVGPPPTGAGYGLGNYGSGAYGYGTGSSTPLVGTPITATDWTLDNWGSWLMACPTGGGIYYFDPESGFSTATLIPTAPPVNTGMFVSTSQQILVAYGSAVIQNTGYAQNPLLVQWSAVGDPFNWTPSSTTQAGNFVIPLGSKIVAALAGASQNFIWTDLDVWSMNYQGVPFVYGFTKIGAGAGAVSLHSIQQLRGSIFWMGPSNFYVYNGSRVAVLPCPVWDAVFQNLNTAYLGNVRAMPNTPFNEAGWLYPSAASSSGECDSYVKFNVVEQGEPWDYGPISRSAWIDQTALGSPIGASPQGLIYQHEISTNADGGPLTAAFTTGYFYIAEGEEFAYVDQIYPDFKWGTFAGSPSAQINLTFNVANFLGDTPISYGPYSVTQATDYVATRFRGRLMSITVASSDLDSFWRIGSIKYRWAPAGRR